MLIRLLDLPPYLNSTQRAFQLDNNWGFSCSCKLCSSTGLSKRQSDTRLRRIEKIIEDLNVLPEKRKPDPLKAERLVKLHEQEGHLGPIAGAQMYFLLHSWIQLG
jgi:hypothetical protein